MSPWLGGPEATIYTLLARDNKYFIHMFLKNYKKSVKTTELTPYNNNKL